ncbi:hypothetical protein NKR19_g6870 [Coniochaeta hoffmannii]|uniref:Uncharacterized protein n=1 Tax=Coniochaeta hoffmannii TaxID=91930 RepID=A0AA38VHM4_9PEZI|nr:hypothetical protein NKR19_g6870 [Coniochaeta hoffmannii]
MDLLKETMLPEQRLCIPQIHGATSIQVFVHTGGAWDPSFRNTRLYTVSVDIIIGGNLNTPPDLPNGSEQLCPIPETTQGRQPVPVISIFYQLMTKLSAYSTRRETGGAE